MIVLAEFVPLVASNRGFAVLVVGSLLNLLRRRLYTWCLGVMSVLLGGWLPLRRLCPIRAQHRASARGHARRRGMRRIMLSDVADIPECTFLRSRAFSRCGLDELLFGSGWNMQGRIHGTESSGGSTRSVGCIGAYRLM